MLLWKLISSSHSLIYLLVVYLYYSSKYTSLNQISILCPEVTVLDDMATRMGLCRSRRQ